MKKKIILGALALSSILAFAQTTEESNSTSDRKFWGTQCHTEQTRGTEKSSTICCYYVMWVNTGCHEAG